MIYLILPEDLPLAQTVEQVSNKQTNLNELYSVLFDLEDMELDAIYYQRLDLLPEIREDIAKVKKMINELEKKSCSFGKLF